MKRIRRMHIALINNNAKARERTVNKKLHQKIYQDPRWKRLRAEKFKANPLCEQCELKGITKVTDEVHHKIPWETGKTPKEQEALAFDYDNTESLCIPCHKIADKKFKFKK